MTEEIITDYFGKPIGKLIKDGDKTTVTDYCGKPLGTADKNGTRDFTGKPVSPNNVPEILLDREDD